MSAMISSPVQSRSSRSEPAEDRSESGIELTILMPCLNEVETIAKCIANAQQFLATSGVRGEVLISDNGSTDGSIALAESLGARVVPAPVRGYGGALICGIEAARGTYVVMGDADDSYDFSNLMPFLERLRAGDDLVMGNRFRGGIEPGAMPVLHRYLGNPVLSFLGRLFFRIPVGDFHCGLRGFRRSAIAALDLKTTGMEFASEMVVRTALQKLSMSEVPTTLKPDGRSRAPHLKTWRDGWRHLKFLLIYSPKWLFFYPGFLLSALGLIGASLLMFGPVRLAPSVALDLSSFLAACLVTIIGVQLVTFGALARYYAATTGMLPHGPRSNRIVAWCTTDRLALVALSLMIVGIVLFGASLFQWARVDFGALVDPMVPRLVAGGVSIIAIGVQIGFAGFLFGIFDIDIARRPPK